MNLTLIKKSLSIALVATLATAGLFALIEPSTASALTATTSVVVTLNVTSGVSITANSPTASMSQSLGVAAASAVGTSTFTVNTNSATGYTLTVQATSTPAMNSTTTVNSILDYQTGAPNSWVATSGQAYFGYSAFGTDVATSTWGTGSSCSGSSANATSTTLKYKGFTTSPFQIASRSATTSFSGVTSTVCYAVEQNNFYIPAGTYQATITATATAS